MAFRGHSRVRIGLVALVAFALLGLAACNVETLPATSSGAKPATTAGNQPVTADIGLIAYVDTNGCIARIAANGDPSSAKAFCPRTRTGVSYLSWLDGERVVYMTPEPAATAWRMFDFTTGADTALSDEDAPKIRVLSDAPWYRSIDGEFVEFSPEGVISRVEGQDRVMIFDPLRGGDTAGLPRMLTWSPDGKWLLIARSTERSLWVISRNGAARYRVAASSRAHVSWWMPNMGALPHLDLTCTTIAAFDCQVSLVSPAPGTTVDPDRARGGALLEWAICPGATGYEVVVYPPGDTTPVIDYVTTGTTIRVPAATLASAPASGWSWKVRSLIGPTAGPWSEEGSFTVAGEK